MADSTEPSAENRRRYENAFLKVSIDEGTPYPCSKQDIESVTGKRYFKTTDKPVLGNFLSMEEATANLERSLLPRAELSASTEAALKRLCNMMRLENKDWGPDIVIKSFNDWDKVFFKRRLKDHVEICWRKQADIPKWTDGDVYGHHIQQAISWRWRHAKIELNADLLLLGPVLRSMRDGEPLVSPFRGLWGTLLHECCHAYLAILSGSDSDKQEDADGYDGGHGIYFQRCIYAVDRSARALLGVAAGCNYDTDLPQKLFDPRNHKVIPRDSKVPVLKRLGIVQAWRRCYHTARVLFTA